MLKMFYKNKNYKKILISNKFNEIKIKLSQIQIFNKNFSKLFNLKKIKIRQFNQLLTNTIMIVLIF